MHLRPLHSLSRILLVTCAVGLGTTALFAQDTTFAVDADSEFNADSASAHSRPVVEQRSGGCACRPCPCNNRSASSLCLADRYLCRLFVSGAAWLGHHSRRQPDRHHWPGVLLGHRLRCDRKRHLLLQSLRRCTGWSTAIIPTVTTMAPRWLRAASCSVIRRKTSRRSCTSRAARFGWAVPSSSHTPGARHSRLAAVSITGSATISAVRVFQADYQYYHVNFGPQNPFPTGGRANLECGPPERWSGLSHGQHHAASASHLSVRGEPGVGLSWRSRHHHRNRDQPEPQEERHLYLDGQQRRQGDRRQHDRQRRHQRPEPGQLYRYRPSFRRDRRPASSPIAPRTSRSSSSSRRPSAARRIRPR